MIETGLNLRAAVFDLDRTLIPQGSGPIVAAGLREAGLLGAEPHPVESFMHEAFSRFGESVATVALGRAAAMAAQGWPQATVQAVGEQIAPELEAATDPTLRAVLDELRPKTLTILATAGLVDLVAPYAARLGFDELEATHYGLDGQGCYDGTIDGEFVWAAGKARRVRLVLGCHWIEPEETAAWTDSVFDMPLLTLVGHPRVVNPDPGLALVASMRGWPVIGSGDGNDRVSVGRAVADRAVQAMAMDELWPWVRFAAEGKPLDGDPVVLEANHCSRLDGVAVSVTAARQGVRVRVVTDDFSNRSLPIGGEVLRSFLGVIELGPDVADGDVEAQVQAALGGGESVLVFRTGLDGAEGPDGSTMAEAAGVDHVEVAIAGSEQAWPPQNAVPYVLNLADPPVVTVAYGSG